MWGGGVPFLPEEESGGLPGIFERKMVSFVHSGS